jgi:outer membrane protein assembly factor BamD (BamD/ComL family)
MLKGFGCRVVALAGIAFTAQTWATGDFYEQPLQTLSDYLKLDQLPAKTTGEVIDETSKAQPEVPEMNFGTELVALAKKPGPEALASVDKMILSARVHGSNEVLNLLHDVRDVLAGAANATETQQYLEWRLEQADRFGINLEMGKPATKEAVAENAEPPPLNPELVADIERHLAKASPALKPHWLYLRGAVEYRAHNIADSQGFFEKVVKDFPKSPRAEFALYMEIRCQLWKSRAQEYELDATKVVPGERPKLKKLLDEYVARYPHGRLLGDTLGWQGAYAYDGGDYGGALRAYAQQIDLPDHPEIVDSAAKMIERVLSHIASQPNDKAFAEVAKHPQAAQALVYLVINTAESDNYNGKIDPVDEVRGWRKKVLPRLATAISAQAKSYQGADWKPRYLAMLAYAASGAGQQDQALKLLQTAGPAIEESDDLLMAHGVVLHRAKQPGEAVKTLEKLLTKFPKSPLARGAQLRMALALTDDRRAGEAVLTLHKLLPESKDPSAKPDADKKPEADQNQPEADMEEIDYPPHYQITYGIDTDQVNALMDTLLNFAPVEELAAAAQQANLDPVRRLELTEPIAQRLLAKEQFDEAKKYLTPAQFGLVAAGLEKLTNAAREAKEPAARAAACLKLAEAWAAARGKLLTYPLDTDERRKKIYIDFAAKADTRRVDAAPFINAAGNYKLDLENRDELRHAFNWWLEASDAQPGSPQNAPALWKALKAMPLIADVSPYTFERAMARKWGDTSHKLYDRLRTECADSVEAKRYAVWWDFVAIKNKTPEGDVDQPYRGEAGTGFTGVDAFSIQGWFGDRTENTEALSAQITQLQAEVSAADIAAARKKAEGLQLQARRAYVDLYDARWVNLLDDLALFLSEPDPGAAVRKQYAALRFRFVNQSAIGGNGYDDDRGDNNPDQALQKDIEAALSDPATKPVADYFAFLNLAVIANHFTFVKLNAQNQAQAGMEKEEDTYRTHDYPQLAKATQAFLEKYPKSKKREAALLLHARAVYRASEQVALKKSVTWPRAPRWEGGNEPTLTQQEPFDAKRVLAALDAYDQAFPKGRYASDIRNYRAAVEFRLQHWKPALALTLAQLDGQENRGLDGEAANRLGDIFAQLADERDRADLLAAIKENPRARAMLEKYLAAESDQHPLLYMKSWLRQQLAAK